MCVDTKEIRGGTEDRVVRRGTPFLEVTRRHWCVLRGDKDERGDSAVIMAAKGLCTSFLHVPMYKAHKQGLGIDISL